MHRDGMAQALLSTHDRNTHLLVQILDEATSALDAGTEAAVQQTLDDIIQGSCMTVVVIAHRLATVQSCSCIIVLHKGVVAETGTHDELLAAGGIYSDLVTQQSLSDLGTSDTESDDGISSNNDVGRTLRNATSGESLSAAKGAL